MTSSRTCVITVDDLLPYVCHYEGCEKRFKSKRNLVYHLGTHEPDRYPCTFPGCVERFSHEQKRMVHYKRKHVHSSQWVECKHPGCGKRFPANDAMMKHWKSIHSGVRFKCPFANCGKAFKEKSTLTRHVNNTKLHRGLRPFFCTTCDLSFSTNGGMNDHKKSLTHQRQVTFFFFFF